VARGEYILAAEAHEEFRAIGGMVKRSLENWVHTLPPRLEGLTASQMVPLLQNQIHAILTELATSEPPEPQTRTGKDGKEYPAPKQEPRLQRITTAI
jgi:hypothetical protein